MESTDDSEALRELEAVALDLPSGLEPSWLGVSGYCLTYDNFFSPLGRPQDLAPRINLAGVRDEVKAASRDARVAARRRIDR